ncbi:Crp/Fnr family transcriptional regulator [uncultured Ruminococcus sp.]|uniref:Crp/Fnr family transcriptional regulator n=1 Tax=uncultured Ruminococcus sp. TaxID=165186 RepID=UPI0025FCE78C|nr:Crp/Fnr family transcriptional regulator [uncultured Ruminococcus sp.]
MNELLLENGFSIENTGSARSCYGARIQHCEKGGMILRRLRDTGETAVVLEGTVLLINVNSDGQKNIIDICREGDAFGGGVFPERGLDACYAIARTDCVIAFIDHDRLLHCCEQRCDRHAALIDMLMGQAARRSIAHIDILTRRTIREKLLTAMGYFLDIRRRTVQSLPLSLSELADYLGCDRSAMMREIKRLNDEGVLHSAGRKITLLTDLREL